MRKSQLVMARGHVINTAKSALELSNKLVIFITGRNVTLGKRVEIRDSDIEMSRNLGLVDE